MSKEEMIPAGSFRTPIREQKTTVGTVVSDKMDKSVVVAVDRIKAHRLYKKKYTVTKRYFADDAENQYKVGDVVEIVSCKPLSKNKKYTVVRKIK